MTIAPRPLRIANEVFLVSSMIERCPKTMMLRELVMNAIEAARDGDAPPRVHIRPLLIDDVPKLSIWNTGEGLSPEELDGVCDLASSLHKQTGLDQKFRHGRESRVPSLQPARNAVSFLQERPGQRGRARAARRHLWPVAA